MYLIHKDNIEQQNYVWNDCVKFFITQLTWFFLILCMLYLPLTHFFSEYYSQFSFFIFSLCCLQSKVKHKRPVQRPAASGRTVRPSTRDVQCSTSDHCFRRKSKNGYLKNFATCWGFCTMFLSCNFSLNFCSSPSAQIFVGFFCTERLKIEYQYCLFFSL